jgi:hypothetical protein
MVSKIIQQIFKDIDELIKNSQSNIPVTINNSKFLKGYEKIKERYYGEEEN